MSLKCLKNVKINGIVYTLAQISDFSFVQSIESYRFVYRGGNAAQYIDTENTDFIPIIKPFAEDNDEDFIKISNFNASICNFPYYNATIYKRVAVQIKEGNGTSGTVLASGGFPYDSPYTKVYMAILLDHNNSIGYICYSFYIKDDPYYNYGGDPNVGLPDGYSLVINGGNNAVGRAIFNAFTNIANGGGATHIAKVTGQLSTLSSHLSDVLIVAGGGGGGIVLNEADYNGQNGGGISGSGNNSADQSTGYAFGQGEATGGGGGLYGGYKAENGSGGAGSGYIGNASLSNKKMVGYKVPTSEAASTKTESATTHSSVPLKNTPQEGNGYAKITWLRNI